MESPAQTAQKSSSRSSSRTGGFKWSRKTVEAAVLVAEDRLSNEAIAAKCGVVRRTLDVWKANSEFRQRVGELVEEFAEAAKRDGIARIETRVAALGDRWKRMHQVIEERAADPTMADVPGGKTGLLCREVKLVKVLDLRGIEEAMEDPAPRFTPVEVYAVDTGTLAELRNHERQAAQELGQWTERKDITSAGARLNLLELQEISDDELDNRLAEAEGRAAPQAVPQAS
jgi:hypothetical protein